MNQRILITGSSGALGKALLLRLKLESNSSLIFAPKRGTANFQLDLHDHNRISNIIDEVQPSLIFHLASTFSNDFEEARAINVAAAQKILEVVEMSRSKIRVVLVGSAAEYGLVSKLDNPISEEHVLRPFTIYGLTKAWQTELFYFYASRGINVVLARIFNLLGMYISERLFIGQLYKQMHEFRQGVRNSIELGPLSATRDYIPIDQAVEQLLQIARHGTSGEIYHIASGRPISMNELLDQELEKNGINKNVVEIKVNPENSLGQGVPFIYASIEKTKNLILQKG